MAGRIRDEDIALVREKTPIADVIGEHVQLRNAGGGNLKGICPFHDEKSPSLSVSPTKGLFHCFGCGTGGDVIRFVQNIEHLDFTDAVERLAGRSGIQLRYVEGGSMPRRQPGQRARLIAAHAEAQRFYAEQLRTPEALKAREFLAERGFDQEVAERFGCGFAPSGWDSLTKHLLGRGFTGAELTLAGLARDSARGGLIDRFHRRLLWPIRDTAGDVVGFGARRLFDDDRVEAKYLNTPGDADLQEEPAALRRGRREEGDRPPAPCGGRRGLHRRDGLPSFRRDDRGGHVRHGVRVRARGGHPAAADGQ